MVAYVVESWTWRWCMCSGGYGTVLPTKVGPTHHAALSDQAEHSPYILHGAYYLKDGGTRPKVW